MDVNSLIKAFSALNLRSSHTPAAKVTAPTRNAQANTSLNSRAATSSNGTAVATPSLADTSLPPQASLLGLPQELRDQIYGYLTEDENRIILGWRFVEAYKLHYPALSYEGFFTSAIALHPLSMTCKQMLNEFQPALLQATKTRWTFSVNNFDLEQLQFFSDYVNTGIAIKLTGGWWTLALKYKTCHYTTLVYNVELRLRFQLDNNATSSFAKLRDLYLSMSPDGHNSIRSFQCLKSADIEVASRYDPRTSSSANHIQCMTKEEAKSIQSSFRDLTGEYAVALRDWGENSDDRFSTFGRYCELMHPWERMFTGAVDDTWVGQEDR